MRQITNALKSGGDHWARHYCTHLDGSLLGALVEVNGVNAST